MASNEYIVLEYDDAFVSGVTVEGAVLVTSFHYAMKFPSYDAAMAFAVMCADYDSDMQEHPEKLQAYKLIGL